MQTLFLFLKGWFYFVNNPTFFVRVGGKGGVNVGKNIFVSRTVLLCLNVFVVKKKEKKLFTDRYKRASSSVFVNYLIQLCNVLFNLPQEIIHLEADI